MWTNAEEVRKIIGLKVDDVTDQELEFYIDMAQKEIRDQISVYVFEEDLSGNVDGSNTTFTTKYSPIADSNFDLKVNASDIEIYKWGDSSSFDTRETVSVSTLYWDRGMIILSEAPASTYDVVRCNYYYYPRIFDLNRLKKITALLAGYYYIRSELLLVPKTWAHGAYRFAKGEPLEQLLNDYYRELESIIGRDHIKREHDTITILRDEVDVE